MLLLLCFMDKNFQKIFLLIWKTCLLLWSHFQISRTNVRRTKRKAYGTRKRDLPSSSYMTGIASARYTGDYKSLGLPHYRQLIDSNTLVNTYHKYSLTFRKFGQGGDLWWSYDYYTLYNIIGGNKYRKTTNIEERNGITQCKKSFDNPETSIVHHRCD